MVRIAVPDDTAETAAGAAGDVRGEGGRRDGGLRRELGLFGAVSMIVGIVIGSGIFLGVNRVAAGAGSPWLIVLIFLIGGALTLMGALTYAELGVLFPKAGGEYVFLREGLGSLLAFLSGWTAFTINLAGSAAALAIIFASQLFVFTNGNGSSVLLDAGWLKVTTPQVLAAALILLLSTVNYFGLRLGANVQKALTVGKGTLMVVLAAAALLYLGSPATPEAGFFESPAYSTYDTTDCTIPGDVSTCTLVAHQGFDPAGFFALALVAALFAYDGWTNVVRVGGEIREPGRNLPKAMILGLGAVMVLYILLSLGYLNVLGFQGFADGAVAGLSDSPRLVASNTASHLFGDGDGGPNGRDFVAVMILVSVLGSLNGITISGPRIYYAMGRDRLFPRIFGDVNRHHVPGRAIWAQAGIAIAFLFLFNFEQLTDNVVFISFLFYALAALGLLVLRRTHPELPRPYKVPGYPVVPILFILASLAFVGYLVYDQVVNFSGSNVNRIAAFLVVLAGIPVYAFYRARLVKECRAKGLPEPEPVFGPVRSRR